MTVDELKEKFIEIYGHSEEKIRVFSAPGRVNLIGEHTDYNGGYVFPAALTMGTFVVARARADRILRLAATDLEDRVEASLDRLEEYRHLKWGNYQLGVADQLQKHGYGLTGCDMLFHGTLPYGAGLSSSASIEVATALTLATLGKEAFGEDAAIDLVELAKIGQKAENLYVGVNCGIMDQFASAMGKVNHAIFLNAKDLSYKLVPLNLGDNNIVIANTNKKRGLGDSKYNERRRECETGLDVLKTVLPGISCLGDVSYEQFIEHKHVIKDEVIRKRVEHVVSENDRVKKSVETLYKGNLSEFGRLMVDSHCSLRDLYEVTGIELDTLVEEALKIDGVLGSRMTGAGFGGCSVSIVKKDATEWFIEKVGREYERKVGLKADFYVSEARDGARENRIGNGR
ncbi:MAG: galactokinase [Clostridiaceae bacterium]|nr:galactokinase [Clostridiaceae bacterium]